jgi:hypothetical protein
MRTHETLYKVQFALDDSLIISTPDQFHRDVVYNSED